MKYHFSFFSTLPFSEELDRRTEEMEELRENLQFVIAHVEEQISEFFNRDEKKKAVSYQAQTLINRSDSLCYVTHIVTVTYEVIE